MSFMEQMPWRQHLSRTDGLSLAWACRHRRHAKSSTQAKAMIKEGEMKGLHFDKKVLLVLNVTFIPLGE